MSTNNDANKHTTIIQVCIVVILLFICVPVFLALMKAFIVFMCFAAAVVYFTYSCLKKKK